MVGLFVYGKTGPLKQILVLIKQKERKQKMGKKKIKKIVGKVKKLSKKDLANNQKIVEETEGYVDDIFRKPKGKTKTAKVKEYVDDIFRRPKNG
jgi:hypothetical protein